MSWTVDQSEMLPHIAGRCLFQESGYSKDICWRYFRSFLRLFSFCSFLPLFNCAQIKPKLSASILGEEAASHSCHPGLLQLHHLGWYFCLNLGNMCKPYFRGLYRALSVCWVPCCLLFFSRKVVSHFSRPCGLWPARLLWPWDFPGKNTEVGYHFLL